MSSRSPDLPRALRAVPVAHRGLHDRARGIVENSRAAAEAAIAVIALIGTAATVDAIAITASKSTPT